jgi:hypothetical protein
MQQHYLAKTYQNGFRSPDTPPKHEPYVWVLDRTSGKWKKRAPKNFAAMSDLHTLWLPDGTRDDSVETQLSQIEGAFARALRHDFEKGPLSPQQRADVASFLSALLVRPPRVIRDLVPALLGDGALLKRLSDDLPGFATAMSERFGHGDPHKLAEWFAQLSPNQQKAVVFWIMLPTIPDNAKKLYGRTWIYAITTTERPYITSDTPVCLFTESEDRRSRTVLRLDDPKMITAVPLSSTVAVITAAGDRQVSIKASDGLIEEINHRVLWQSRDFVVSCRTSFLGDDEVPRWVERRGPPDLERVSMVLSRLNA